MQQIEENIVRSFNGVKYDFASVNTKIYELIERNNELEKAVFILRDQIKQGPKIIKTKSKAKKTKFVGAKEGNKFHRPTCPFAKNIKPKSKITFSTKNLARNKGYKPCKCIN